MPKLQSTTSTTTSRPSTTNVPTIHNEQSLGPNLQSRLEALEAAMGVRLNVAKRQGRHSVSNTTSSSPMQISPTSTASTTISSTTTTTTSLSVSSRHNIPTRTGQGVQRSSSSCDAENRPGPSKRLKPSLPLEASSTSTASAIATIKKYTPQVRRPLTATITSPKSTSSKHTALNKQRSVPVETSSTRTSRSSIPTTTPTTHNNNNNTTNTSQYRTTHGTISKASHNATTIKQTLTKAPSSPPPPPRPATFPRKQTLSIFGEQFSSDILKTNLLWINSNELDDEGRMEVLIQFGSMENFIREQQLFAAKQQQQLKLAAKNKTVVNRSRFQLFIPKKDRLELL